MFTPRTHNPVGAPAGRSLYRVVLALPGHPSMIQAARQLREHGCRVLIARTASEARRLVRDYDAHAVVLPWLLDEESGPLVADKMLRANPRLRVVLVGPDTPRNRRFAQFVKAAGFVSDRDDVAALVRAVVPQRPVATPA